MEDKIEPSMESKSDYDEWLQSGHEKAEDKLNQIDNDTKESFKMQLKSD